MNKEGERVLFQCEGEKRGGGVIAFTTDMCLKKGGGEGKLLLLPAPGGKKTLRDCFTSMP